MLSAVDCLASRCAARHVLFTAGGTKGSELSFSQHSTSTASFLWQDIQSWAVQANTETDWHVLDSLSSCPPVLEASSKSKWRRGHAYQVLWKPTFCKKKNCSKSFKSIPWEDESWSLLWSGCLASLCLWHKTDFILKILFLGLKRKRKETQWLLPVLSKAIK